MIMGALQMIIKQVLVFISDMKRNLLLPFSRLFPCQAGGPMLGFLAAERLQLALIII